MLDTRKGMLKWLDDIAVVIYWVNYPTGDKMEKKLFDNYEKAIEWIRKHKKLYNSVDIL